MISLEESLKIDLMLENAKMNRMGVINCTSKFENKLDLNKCKKCIHGDENGDCVTKEEAPFGSFICRQNEQFELYEE